METFLALFNAAWTAGKNILSLFGIGNGTSKPDENTQAVEVSNKAGKLSADEARVTRAQTDKDLVANDAQTDTDLAAVRASNSLSDNADTINSGIARSRPHTDTNS